MKKKQQAPNVEKANAVTELIAACEAPEWTAIWTLLNAFASGKTQNQFARVEPLAVLGEVYHGMAMIFQRSQAAAQRARKELKGIL